MTVQWSIHRTWHTINPTLLIRIPATTHCHPLQWSSFLLSIAHFLLFFHLLSNRITKPFLFFNNYLFRFPVSFVFSANPLYIITTPSLKWVRKLTVASFQMFIRSFITAQEELMISEQIEDEQAKKRSKRCVHYWDELIRRKGMHLSFMTISFCRFVVIVVCDEDDREDYTCYYHEEERPDEHEEIFVVALSDAGS